MIERRTVNLTTVKFSYHTVVLLYVVTYSTPPQAAWNMSLLQSGDLMTAVQAMMEKQKPNFSYTLYHGIIYYLLYIVTVTHTHTLPVAV